MPALKKTILAALSVLVSLGLVVFLLWRIDLGQAGSLLAAADWRWLGLALIFTLLMPVCTTIRWKGVLRALPGVDLPFLGALRAVMTANVLNSFMPSKGGDIVKAVYLRRYGGLSQGVGTVLLERMIDFAVLGALGLAGYFWSGALWGLLAGCLLLGAIAVAFAIVLWAPLISPPFPAKIRDKLANLRRVFHHWVRRPDAIAQTVLGSVGNWSLAGLTVCALISALRLDVAWGYAYSVFPLGILAGLVPTTVSGIGARDSALVALLQIHTTKEAATLVALGYTCFAYWLLSLVSFPAVALSVVAFLRAPTARR